MLNASKLAAKAKLAVERNVWIFSQPTSIAALVVVLVEKIKRAFLANVVVVEPWLFVEDSAWMSKLIPKTAGVAGVDVEQKSFALGVVVQECVPHQRPQSALEAASTPTQIPSTVGLVERFVQKESGVLLVNAFVHKEEQLVESNASIFKATFETAEHAERSAPQETCARAVLVSPLAQALHPPLVWEVA